jgi:tripartite-type tricarboxylate transporter receptor subunit TctC
VTELMTIIDYEVVDKYIPVRLLNAELRAIVQMDDVKAKLATQGMEAAGGTPAEFRAVIETEAAQWARVIKAARITAR